VPLVTFVISTFNRREVLLPTLAQLRYCGLPASACEIIVIDNASSDGTASAVTSHHPDVYLIALRENRGSCAKNLGVVRARGRFIVFLDDDSFPQPWAVQRMTQKFDADPKLGAVGFTVTLPDGSRECSAYPDVFIGCGVGLRREALEQVGGLPDDFFMQAEEYDLSLRLLDAEWNLRTFDDLHVTHLKTPAARASARTMRLDVRNNLTLIGRYFPDEWAGPFAMDWMTRYGAIAAITGRRLPYFAGLAQGIVRSIDTEKRRPVSAATFERFAKIDAIRSRFAAAQRQLGFRRVLFADWGKNILPYRLAAEACGVEIVGIADSRLSRAGMRYRAIPVLDDGVAARTHVFDAVVVSNHSPVHARLARERWRVITDKPVIDLFEFESAVKPQADTIGAGPVASGCRRTAARNASRAA
jgi:glycosyltransferase involved in cell wall biosynthesis